MKSKKVLVGRVGVDSGQILICDPCYIDSSWRREDFVDDRRYRHEGTGDVLVYGKDFKDYEEKLKVYDKTMNEMMQASEVYELPPRPAKNVFSYNACCIATSTENGFGEIDEGTAVVTSSGYGDGLYPVYAIVEGGRVKKIWVDFFDDGEEDEE